MSGYCNLYKQTSNDEYFGKIEFLSQKLLQLKNNEWSGACWGYNFDWQSRAFYLPKIPHYADVMAIHANAYEIKTKPSQKAGSPKEKEVRKFVILYSPLIRHVFNASLWAATIV
ncbi:MAG: hypothetical protein IPH45_18890 [Bacteroidales bacterium]|nr:hypothetical protein [Bacteroidales bacterium]